MNLLIVFRSYFKAFLDFTQIKINPVPIFKIGCKIGFHMRKLSKETQKFFYLSLIYFFSGLPFGFFYTFIPVFLRTEGISLVHIGLFSLASLPWSLRLLWAPLIDRYFNKTFWMGISLISIGIVILSLAFIPPQGITFFILLILLCFFSSVFDTAADGFVVEWIPSATLGKANGLRIAAYRLALITFGGGLVAVSHYLGFKSIFYLIFLVSLSIGLFLLLNPFLKHNLPKKTYSLKDQFILPIVEILKRKGVFTLLLFVFTYKIGDSLLGAMVYPFWVDRGFSRLEIGLVAGSIGSLLTILGSLLGGYLSSRWTAKKSLLTLGLFQAFSNLGYTFASISALPKETVYLASVIESFTGGLGTAAFVTFLTKLCQKEFSSTQYAVFSTLFSLSLTLSRSLSGVLTTYLGYTLFFGLTFLVSLPVFLLIPKVTQHLNSEGS